MIRLNYSSASSYYQTEELQTRTTIWTSDMGISGGMRFYEEDSTFVVDMRLGDMPDETLMILYPHNDKKKNLEIAENNEETIRKILKDAMLTYPDRRLFSIVLSPTIRLLAKEDFKYSSPSAGNSAKLFTFDNPDLSKGFPRLYIYETTQFQGTYGDVFRVLAKMSRIAFPCVERPTSEGARFTYMLINSFMNAKFEGEVPTLSGVSFPTKLNCEFPVALNTEEFEKFLISAGVDKIRIKEGKIVEQPEDEQNDTFLPIQFLSVEDEKELENLLKRQVLEKDSANLGDVLSLGFEKLLAMIPISDKIISINCDLSGLLRKMCVHQGIFHAIPLSVTDDLADILDISEELIKICTEETFPKKMLPLLPSIDTDLLQ